MKKNIFKKIVASLATVAMAAGLFTAMPAEEAKAADDTVTVRIKVTGELVASADNMNFYNWVPGETLGGWPGSAMTKEAAGLFYIDVEVPASTTVISGKFNGDVESNDVTGIEVKKEVATVTIASDKSYTIAYSGNDLQTVDLDEGKQTKNIEVNVKYNGTTNEKMYAHVWEDGFAGSKVQQWPGYELTLANGVYSATIPVEASEDAVKMLVHNESESVKTSNLDVDVSAGKVYITVEDDNTADVATSKPASWTTSSSTGTGSTTTTGNKTTEKKSEVKVEVTLDPSLKWDEVYVHAWGDNFSTKWPGVKMTAKDGKYYATIDTKLTKLSYVISAGDGKDQTIDIADVNGQDVKITVTAKKDAEGKKFVATAAGAKGAANTGDVAPVVVMLVVAMAAASVVIASKKKTICE